ncbi:hypothetical protein FOXB_05785, partial [Fusarium oxysporum f. sp. conglutinans Fo5176]
YLYIKEILVNVITKART